MSRKALESIPKMEKIFDPGRPRSQKASIPRDLDPAEWTFREEKIRKMTIFTFEPIKNRQILNNFILFIKIITLLLIILLITV